MLEKAPPAASASSPAASAARPLRVFVSYSRDDDDHIAQVRAFADELRRHGLDAWIDQYEDYVEHWPSWMVKQCEDADCILVVVTQRYLELFQGARTDARGVPFESVLIHNRAYDPDQRRGRLGVVSLSAAAHSVPSLLAGAPRAAWPAQRDAVLRLAYGVSEVEPPPIGPAMPPMPKGASSGSAPSRRTDPTAATPAPSDSTGGTHATRLREDARMARLEARASAMRSRGEDTAEIDAEIRAGKRERLQGHGLRMGDAVGPFELLRQLGQGGFATVWLATDTRNGGQVALKVLHQHWAQDETRVQQFERGARRIMGLSHPHVVQVVEAPAEFDGYRVFAMRYLPAGDLAKALPRLDVAQRRQVLDDVAGALQHAHDSGLVHRDVKPSNVLLDADHRACLADFDLVKARDTFAMTRQMGDLFYGAPEVLVPAEGAAETDRRADVYSFALVVLFTRGAKIQGHGPDAVEASLQSADANERERKVLRRALAKDPRMRQESVRAFWTELQRAGEVEDGGRRAAMLVALAIAVLVAGVLSFGPWFWPRPTQAMGSRTVASPALKATAERRQKLRELGLELLEIPAGSFVMGSEAGEIGRDLDEGPVRTVSVAKFRLARTEVTNAQYRVFVEATGHPTPESWSDPTWNGDDYPVVGVSWDDAKAFCAWAGLRLPTEAEWEYACRAGTTTPFSFGSNITTEQVNFDGNYPYAGGKKGEYRQRTVPVGSLPANAWGLHEMHGNVWEWCEDWKGHYSKAPTDGSTQQEDQGSGQRVLRGGSWFSFARRCRSAYRDGGHPGFRRGLVGFRPASSSP